LKHYTYAHTKPDGTIFYIGKGVGKRAWQTTNRNDYWKKIVAKYGSRKVEILANWDTHEEAISHEILLISCFRDMGYKLANLTDGGDGNFGYLASEETKAKMSAAHVGFVMPDEAKQKIRDSKWGVKNPGFKGAILATNIATGEQKTYVGNKQLENDGFSNTCVYRCIKGERKTHKGHIFARLGE